MTLLANHTPGNHTPGNHTSCQAPEQYQWAMKYLGQCVLNDMQMVGMCLGLFSILCWLLAQAPYVCSRCLGELRPDHASVLRRPSRRYR